eukprot:COSAG01_NODE_959_length_12451_cov_18.389815_3_plen_43_part_00
MLPDEALQLLFGAVDADGGGTVDAAEFNAWLFAAVGSAECVR